MHDLDLVDAAWQAREHAHAPYSNYQVGVALATTEGKIFTGCNVENASYPCCLCAEATAIGKAVSEGGMKPGGLAAIAVAVDTNKPAPPCGKCRQIIEEFAAEDARVLLSSKRGEIVHEFNHKELLPFSFNGTNLDET